MIENIGGIIFQFLTFTVLLLLIFAIYFGLRYLANRVSAEESREEVIEEKLDKIINMLEKNELDKL